MDREPYMCLPPLVFSPLLCAWNFSQFPAAAQITAGPSPSFLFAPPYQSIPFNADLMGIHETFPALAKENLEIQPASVRYEYDPWLLDDHPLRSHPTECIPGLGQFFGESLTSLQLRWKETLIRAGCLLLACLSVNILEIRGRPKIRVKLMLIYCSTEPHSNASDHYTLHTMVKACRAHQ